MLQAAISGDGLRVLVWNGQHASVFATSPAQPPLFQIAAQKNFRGGSIAASGRRIALLDGRFRARTWNIDAAKECAIDNSPSPSLHLALNGAGTRLTIAMQDSELAVFETDSGFKVSPSMRHRYMPTLLIATPDGARTVSSGRDGQVLVWDAASGQPALSPIRFQPDTFASVDCSRDGAAVLVSPRTGVEPPVTVAVWRSTRVRVPRLQTFENIEEMAAARLSPDGRLGCLSLAPVFRAYVYELATGRVVLNAPTKGDVYVHLFAPDMHRYYALTANGWLHGWSLETGQPLWPPTQQPAAVRPAEISPDGAFIAAGYSDGHVRIFDTATGRLIRTLDHPGEVKVLRFAPDGSGRFLSASTDHLAHVWSLKTGEKLSTFAGHTDTIIAGGWSPDSRSIATASYDGTTRVWEAATGRALCPPMPHATWLAHLEFSPDGNRLATACRDGTVRLWNPHTGEPTSEPLAQASTADTVRFTADGKCLLVRDHFGFSFWDAARAERVTVHYPGIFGGFGMDAEPYGAILTADGTRVHLGAWLREGVLWTIPQPRSSVPEWLPDFFRKPRAAAS